VTWWLSPGTISSCHKILKQLRCVYTVPFSHQIQTLIVHLLQNQIWQFKHLITHIWWFGLWCLMPFSTIFELSSSSWLYGIWIYNNLCNQCLSPLKLWVWIPLRRGVLDTALYDKVCQWLGGYLDIKAVKVCLHSSIFPSNSNFNRAPSSKSNLTV
jgi:hypothetical protein